MVKAGWEFRLERVGDWRKVRFHRHGPLWAAGENANDALAAMEAMQGAGY